jgi:hypothetical protein
LLPVSEKNRESLASSESTLKQVQIGQKWVISMCIIPKLLKRKKVKIPLRRASPNVGVKTSNWGILDM